jgi:hypothetical protein
LYIDSQVFDTLPLYGQLKTMAVVYNHCLGVYIPYSYNCLYWLASWSGTCLLLSSFWTYLLNARFFSPSLILYFWSITIWFCSAKSRIRQEDRGSLLYCRCLLNILPCHGQYTLFGVSDYQHFSVASKMSNYQSFSTYVVLQFYNLKYML